MAVNQLDTAAGRAREATRLIVLLGLVSLFADVTYEAARSVNGPYLALLGASGAVVGFTAGLGELFGYGLRIISGIVSDKTRRYWAITIAGYTVNLLAVPLLALAGSWELAAALMVTERIGKAIRTPARDVMLSHATSAVGRGWGFALHEAMDQIGGMTGPVIVMLVLAYKGSYTYAYAVLVIPAILAIITLMAARAAYPHPGKLENARPHDANHAPPVFWLYLAAVGLIAAGFADYPLMAYHIKTHGVFEDKWIPLLYAFAMGVDGVAALYFGKWYDRKGMASLMGAIIISSPFALFAFSTDAVMVIAGAALWGVGLGAQESIIRAVVADIIHPARRGSGFGYFNAGYGFAWFLGSAVMGLLYDVSIPALVMFSVAMQLASLPLLARVRRRMAAA
ncbi:MAG: MFS transporter [Nitrospinae bacterium]|nr:MFS transporter [Nitrospinota bacterium]